jgi:hypothetical protein
MRLFKALQATDDGMDIHEIGELLHLDVSDPVGSGRQLVFGVIRELRIMLGRTEAKAHHGLTLPIRYDGTRQVYFITAVRADGEDWQKRRVRTDIARAKVDLAYWQSLAAGSDGRTVEGRIARVHVVGCQKLIAGLQEIEKSLTGSAL